MAGKPGATQKSDARWKVVAGAKGPPIVIRIRKLAPGGKFVFKPATKANDTVNPDRSIISRLEPSAVPLVTRKQWTLNNGVTVQSVSDLHGGALVSTRLKSGIVRVNAPGVRGTRIMFLQVGAHVQNPAAAIAEFAAKQTTAFAAFVVDASLNSANLPIDVERATLFIELAPGDSQTAIEQKLAAARVLRAWE